MGPDLILTDDECTNQGVQIQQTADPSRPIILLYVFFLFMFQSLFRISDTALNVLITFFSMFLKTLASTFTGIPTSFTKKLPFNLHSARKAIDTKNVGFERYISCTTCRSIYNWDECTVRLQSGELQSKRCSFILFPNHPQVQHQKPCDTVLMKTMKCSGGKTVLYPRMIFTYKSILESLQEMLDRPGFSEKCELCPHQDEIYTDIYDGDIWKEFQNSNGAPFLSVCNNFAFQMNVDWFNPFIHTQHSEGAIYLSILNLPRHERFLQENVLLLGIIPGPKEPSLHINSYLRPLVDEVKLLWRGVCLKNLRGVTILVRGALLCVGCDIPAARKVGSFVGHRATKGCSKCHTSFPKLIILTSIFRVQLLLTGKRLKLTLA